MDFDNPAKLIVYVIIAFMAFAITMAVLFRVSEMFGI
jgi:hypothetical protein